MRSSKVAIKWQKRCKWNNKYELSPVTGWKDLNKELVALGTYIPAPKCGMRAKHLCFNWISSKYLFQESSIRCSREIQERHFGGKAQASKCRHSLSIGLSTKVLFTFTLAHRTKPFLSRRTSKTLRRGHVLRGEFSVLIWTISPTARFLQGNVHFCPLWSRGRYSPDHRFQKVSARYCSCLHLRRHKESSF